MRLNEKMLGIVLLTYLFSIKSLQLNLKWMLPTLRPLYVHDPNFIAQVCLSNGKYDISIVQWVSRATIGNHITLPGLRIVASKWFDGELWSEGTLKHMSTTLSSSSLHLQSTKHKNQSTINNLKRTIWNDRLSENSIRPTNTIICTHVSRVFQLIYNAFTVTRVLVCILYVSYGFLKSRLKTKSFVSKRILKKTIILFQGSLPFWNQRC